MTVGLWLFVGVQATHATLRTVELLHKPDASIEPARWWPWLWVVAFATSAGSLVWFVRHPTPRSYATAGTVTVVSLAGQVAALMAAEQPWSWALTSRSMLWGTVAALFGWVWWLAAELVHPEVWACGEVGKPAQHEQRPPGH